MRRSVPDRATAKAAMREILLDAAATRRTVTYGELALMVFGGLVPARSRYIMDLLSEIDREEHGRTGTIIASLVVRADSGIPGAGYFSFIAIDFGRDVSNPRDAWRIEAEKVWDAYAPGQRSA